MRCIGTKRLAIVLAVVGLLSLGIAARGKPGKAPVEFRISTSDVGSIQWHDELSIWGSDIGWAGSSGWFVSGETAQTPMTFPDLSGEVMACIYRIEKLRLDAGRLKWVVYFRTLNNDEYRVAGEEERDPEPDKISTSYDRESDTWDIMYIFGVWYKKDAQGLFRLQPGSLSFGFTIHRMG